MSTATNQQATSLWQAPGLPIYAKHVFKMLAKIDRGQLNVHTPAGEIMRFGQDDGLSACIHIHDWQCVKAALKSGDIGFAESYMDGHWSTPQLTPLLELMLVNRNHLEQIIYGSWLGALWHRVKHLLNKNTKAGSSKNIHAHYDLGNNFYKIWLDPSMNYSSALFEPEHDNDLTRAQENKMRRALKQVDLAAGQNLLEIGCGWGAMAHLAATESDAKVNGITLSQEQLAYGQQSLQAAGLQHKASLHLIDYRDIAAQFEGQKFDAIVSIEMFEAVGREYWPGYFAAVKQNLKVGGKACIQSITIRDDLFDRYVKGTDFIQQYVFPGGLLPSSSLFKQAATTAGFRVVDEFAFGKDYAKTLSMWRNAFLHHEEQVLQEGFDTRFIKLWEFYLAYCEAAFAQDNISVRQFTLVHA